MTQNFKKRPLSQKTTVDYLTLVFSPNEVARLRFEAKLRFKNGEFKSYKEAYNAMLCAEVFNESASDDIEFTRTESQPVNSDFYYNELFTSNARYPSYSDIPENERSDYFKSIVKKTRKYKTFTSLIEGDLANFMHLLNHEVSNKKDRVCDDVLPWTYRLNSAGMFTYEKSATLYRHDVNSGVVAWGANNGGCMVSFSGTGCAGLDIPKLHKMLEKIPNIKISRIDIAFDDFNGEKPVQSYFQDMESGLFNKTNQTPNYTYIQTGSLHALTPEQTTAWKKDHGWNKKFDAIADGGNTLYVGSRKNGKMARMYEKGKQLSSETQPNWVRAELELRSTDRVIGLDILVNTDAAFAAAYPAFEFITDKRFDVPVLQKRHTALLIHDRLLKYHSLSYGKHINFCRHVLDLSDTQIVDLLTKNLNPWDIPNSINNACVVPANQSQHGMFTTNEQILSDAFIYEASHNQQLSEVLQ